MEKGKESNEKWVHDSSVDYKGRVPLRASTGVWKASLFVLGNNLLHITSLFSNHFNTVFFFHHKLNNYSSFSKTTVMSYNIYTLMFNPCTICIYLKPIL